MIVRERAAPVEGPAARNGVDRAVRPIIVLTFLPFLWKAVSYALLDSYLPLAVFLALAAAVAAGLHVGGRWARWAVRL